MATTNSWVYRTTGEAAGYLNGGFIHALDGTPVGQVHGTHVFTMAGDYAGELYDAQVVNMNRASPGGCGAANPGNAGNRGSPGNRGSHGCPYPDSFERLLYAASLKP